ncbi:hypothetical protein DPMN_144907 [Dreissena polymorpha]|uniref:Uncharacterized protein n=1 Tax=Dreissena polymorpha TaxID=45954 RepID=A0A9D4IX01_DREPO|nr:hypothetical protein DPMN_144907 [Dreissena polymorpha]
MENAVIGIVAAEAVGEESIVIRVFRALCIKRRDFVSPAMNIATMVSLIQADAVARAGGQEIIN